MSDNRVDLVVSVDANSAEVGKQKFVSATTQMNQAMSQLADRSKMVEQAMQQAADNGINLTARQANAAVTQLERLGRSMGAAGSKADQARAAFSKLGLGNLFGPMIDDFEKVGKAAGSAHSGMAGISRELMVMSHEALTGNFKRLGGSAMVLGERINMLHYLLSPLGGAFLATAAGAAVFLALVYEGHEEMSAFGDALKNTSNSLGMTSGDMLALSNGVKVAGESFTTIRTAMAQIAGTGAFTAGQLQLATAAATAMASDTGISTDKAAESLAKIKDGVMKWVTEYQDAHHAFTSAQVEEIDNFAKQGAIAQATKAIMESLIGVHGQIAADASLNMGIVERAYDGAKDAVLRLKGAIMSIGQAAPMQEQLIEQTAKVREAIAQYQQVKTRGENSAGSDEAGALDNLNKQRTALQKLLDLQTSLTAQSKARATGDAAVSLHNYLDSDKYATPERRHQNDLDSETVQWGGISKQVIAQFGKNSQQFQDALKRHYENVAQINEQYAKKQKKPSEAGTNANIAAMNGDNTRDEHELKRHLDMLKSMYQDGEMTQAAYLQRVHDAQVQALQQRLAIDKQIEAAASTKRNPSAAVSAHNKTLDDQASLDDLNADPTGSGAALKGMQQQAKQLSDMQAKFAQSMQQTQSQWDAQSAESTMGTKQKQQYEQMLQMREQYLQQIETINQQYNAGLSPEDQQAQQAARDTALQELQDEYNQKLQMYTEHQQQQEQLQNSYSTQIGNAFAQISDTGTTSAQTTADAFTKAWSDSESALNTFLTTGKGNFDQFASGVLADMAKIMLQWAEMQALQGALGAFGISMGGAGAMSGAMGSTPATVSGSAAWGLGSTVTAATGGHITGAGTGTSDSIPAMLSNGEYVINAKSTAKYKGLLENINSGNLSHFATGGPVGSVTGAATSSGTSSNPVSVTVNHNGGGGLSDADAKQLHQVVQSFVDQRMAYQIRRQGGYAYQIRHGQI